ncbi:hypothetical protein GCM10010399_37500 [Dactylosporangium fulvum]
MACFPDLTPYAYIDHDTVGHEWGRLQYHPQYERRNVGWLDASQPFDRGPVPDWFAGALLDVIGDPPVNETRGLHDCEFCPPDTNPRRRSATGVGGAAQPGARGPRRRSVSSREVCPRNGTPPRHRRGCPPRSGHGENSSRASTR